MKRKNLLISLFLLIFMVLLLVLSRQTAQALRRGLSLCGTVVLPTLFPFLVLSSMLSAFLPRSAPGFLHWVMGRYFGVSGLCGFPLALSLLGGYPLGAATVSNLYLEGALPKAQAEKALRFCNNSGPGIFIGFLGGVLGSPLWGLRLYLIHVLSGLLVGILLSPPASGLKIQSLPRKFPDFSTVFLKAVRDSAMTMVQICGLILFFSPVPMLLSKLPIPAMLRLFLTGFGELTSGLLLLEADEASLVLAAFFTGWGGLCVQMQAYSICQAAGLHPRGCMGEKLLHGLFSALFVMLLLRPSPINWALAGAIGAICFFFPHFRQKMSGNPVKNRI